MASQIAVFWKNYGPIQSNTIEKKIFVYFLLVALRSLFNSTRFLVEVPRKWQSGFLTRLIMKIHEAISEPNELLVLANRTKDSSLQNWAQYYSNLPAMEVVAA